MFEKTIKEAEDMAERLIYERGYVPNRIDIAQIILNLAALLKRSELKKDELDK